MKKHKIKLAAIFFIWFLVSFFGTSKVSAQVRYDIIPPDSLLIKNSNSSSVSFYIRKGAGEWVLFQLPGGGESFYKNLDEIFIKTNDQLAVHYSLELGNRYEIKWLEPKWDLFHLTLTGD